MNFLSHALIWCAVFLTFGLSKMVSIHLSKLGFTNEEIEKM